MCPARRPIDTRSFTESGLRLRCEWRYNEGMTQEKEKGAVRFWWRSESEKDDEACAVAYRPGDPCPECHQGVLDYDSLLRLVCPRCGFFAAGGGYS